MNPAGDIEQQAALWVARRDASPRSAESEAEFQAWVSADIRHRVAYLRHNATWEKTLPLERLRPLSGAIDPDLLAPDRVDRRPRWWAAAAALATICIALLASMPMLRGEKVYVTGVGSYQRIYLQDGSSIELNTDSKVRVRLTETRRLVTLLRGEARFQVAHAANRPFDVVSGGNVVRAVGTAFSVRVLNGRNVEVLVTEGRVVVIPAQVAAQTQSIAQAPRIAAGQAAMIASDAVTVAPVPAPAAARRLAWTTGKLVFDDELLATAAQEFNRYNKVQLEIGDRAVGQVRISGSFDVANVDSFLAALKRVFAIRAEPAAADRLILVQDPSSG
jgi:transmembrane sensor